MAVTASYQAWLAQIAACSKNGAYQFSRKAPAPPPPPPPPTTEQRLAALASTIYSTPRVAALQATDPPHDRLSAGSIYDYRRRQIAKHDFAVDAPAQAGGGVLGNLAESIYETRMKQACGTR